MRKEAMTASHYPFYSPPCTMPGTATSYSQKRWLVDKTLLHFVELSWLRNRIFPQTESWLLLGMKEMWLFPSGGCFWIFLLFRWASLDKSNLISLVGWVPNIIMIMILIRYLTIIKHLLCVHTALCPSNILFNLTKQWSDLYYNTTPILLMKTEVWRGYLP